MTQPKPVNIALIGVGGVGAYHLRSIQLHEKAGRARLLAVADPTADRLAEERKTLKSRGIRWHLDYREMLTNEPDLEAVVIATPIPLHLEMAQACLNRDLFVHLEKPPVPLIQQFEELSKANPDDKVSIGFQMIEARTTRKLKELILGSTLGRILSIRAGACWPRLDSYYGRAPWAGKMLLGGKPVFDGPATNALAHVIHTMMHLAGDTPEGFAMPEEICGELYRAREIESYDTACLKGRFTTGIEFSFAATHATEASHPFAIEVQGTEGWARLSEDGASLESSAGVFLKHPESTQELLDTNHANFLSVIRGESSRFTTRLEDTRGYVSATNATLASSGGIHGIDAKAFRRYHGTDGNEGFDVAGLEEAVKGSIATGKLFNEQGLSWATAKPARIELPFAPDLPIHQLFT
jgi:predicted dehydrogenase